MFAGAMIANIIEGDSLTNWSFDFDAILDGTSVPIQAHKLVEISASFTSGVFYVAGEIRFAGPWLFTTHSNSHLSIIWGPGTIDTVGSARISYGSAPGAASTTFLNTGGLELNGQTIANPFSRTTGTFEPAITITAAALDAAFGPAGFGGLAVNMGGSSYTNQGTP
jgi:hypothetical protein